MKTNKPIDYAAAGSLFSCTIPQGTPVTEATNLPPDADGNTQYWAEDWPGMTPEEESWGRNYGFVISKEDVELCP